MAASARLATMQKSGLSCILAVVFHFGYKFDTLEEARSSAKDVLDSILTAKLEQGDPLPVARTKADPRKGLEAVPVDDQLAVAYTIFEARRGKSAAEVARKMGISRQAYQRLEDPKASLTVATLVKAAKALGKQLDIAFV